MKVLVTGSSGFVGSALCKRLAGHADLLRCAVRGGEASAGAAAGVEVARIAAIGPDTDWRQAVTGVETVIHLAARVHVMQDRSSNPLDEYRRVNVEGTGRLANEAARAGVRRFVFVSSIKVNGEESSAPYSERSPARPSDPYGISKLEAEQCLRQIEAETGMEVVIVRPTLVYGPGVKANFFNMMRVIERGVPLPLASIDNRRSLIHVGNLVDALILCASHHGAAGETFLVSDGEDVSTPELIRRTAKALGVAPRLLPFPPQLIRMAGKMTGKGAAVNRLMGSLTVDSGAIREKLGWHPPFTLDQGLRETAEWYKGRLRAEDRRGKR